LGGSVFCVHEQEWDEAARLNWLQSELNNRRPLFRIRDIEANTIGLDPDIRKTLMVYKVASELDSESLGAYVISQANTASDVLAVMLLQKQFGMTAANGKLMRVVPLFETLDDLVNSPTQLEILFSVPSYIGSVNGKQEVMVGYSDSAKDAGRLAACWVQCDVGDALVHLYDAIRGHWIDGRESHRLLAGWMCADLERCVGNKKHRCPNLTTTTEKKYDKARDDVVERMMGLQHELASREGSLAVVGYETCPRPPNCCSFAVRAMQRGS